MTKTCVYVFISRFLPFFFFLFFFQRMNSEFTVQRQKSLFMHCSTLFTYCSITVHAFKNIKNGSHGTFHTFKNYFATVFSVFSNKKFNPNGPIVLILYGGQKTNNNKKISWTSDIEAAKNKTKISIEYQKNTSCFFFSFFVRTTFDFEYIFFPIAAFPSHLLDIPFVVHVQKYIITIMYYYFLSLQ